MASGFKLYSCLLAFVCATSIHGAIYRAYDVMRGGAAHNGAGATGVSNADSFSSISQNPAALIEFDSRAFAFGFDAQTLISAIESKVNLELQYFPILALSQPIGQNQQLALALHSPFQRRIIGDNFFQYDIDFSYAISLSRNFSVSATLGPSFALQVGDRSSDYYGGWGGNGGLGFFFREKLYSLGLNYSYGANLSYRPFADGRDLDEKMPDIIKGGFSYYWFNRNLNFFGLISKIKKLTLSFEIDYTFWQYSSFVSAAMDRLPAFGPSWEYLHPHFGFHIEFENFLPGLWFRGGFFTEDHIETSGNNNTQYLLTLGLGGLASRNEWGNKLKIDFSLTSSFIPSYIFSSNHQIEKLQITFEFSI